MKSTRRTNYSPVKQMRRPTRYSDEQQTKPVELQHHSGTRLGPLTVQELPDNDDYLESSPEEVYVCSCCGIAKELSPGMEYMSVFRSLFFLINLLVFAFGLADFGMGLWFRIDPKVYEIHKYIETQNFTIAGWIMLFGGFFTCLLSFVGFAGAARQATGLLFLYCVLMIAIMVSFVAAVILLTVYGLGASLERFMVKEIYEQMRLRSMNTEMNSFQNSDAVQFIDFVQVKMRCCGAMDFRDYEKLGINVPTSCYAIEKNYIDAPGCGKAIRALFDLRAGMAAGFVSGSIVIQLIAIILAVLMFCSIYHWRANPRPQTPVRESRRGSPAQVIGSPDHLRPGSRTAIV